MTKPTLTKADRALLVDTLVQRANNTMIQAPVTSDLEMRERLRIRGENLSRLAALFSTYPVEN